MREKKIRLSNEVSVLSVDADLLATKAEKLMTFVFLKESNDKRKVIDNKKLEIKELEAIEEKLLDRKY